MTATDDDDNEKKVENYDEVVSAKDDDGNGKEAVNDHLTTTWRLRKRTTTRQ